MITIPKLTPHFLGAIFVKILLTVNLLKITKNKNYHIPNKRFTEVGFFNKIILSQQKQNIKSKYQIPNILIKIESWIKEQYRNPPHQGHLQIETLIFKKGK